MSIRRSALLEPAPKRARTNAYEIAKIKRTLGERKPEMKAQAYGASETKLNGTVKVYEISDIAAGDEGYARDGLQVKLHRVFYTVSAKVASTTGPCAGVDVYLITSKDAVAPVYADFIAYIGGTVNKAQFSTWKQSCLGAGNDGIVQEHHSFQYPMKLQYAGSAATACIKNRTYIVVKNNTGGSVDVQIASRIWFTDV